MEDFVGSRKFRLLMTVVALLGLCTLAAGGVLRYLGWADYEFVVMAGCALLIVFLLFLYALFPFRVKNDNMAGNLRLEPIWDFSMKVSGFALAVLLTGMVFSVEHWPGNIWMMLVGGVCMVVAGGSWIYYAVQKKQFGKR